MTEKDVIDNITGYVKTMLGSKTVEVEISNSELKTIIEQALRKLRPYYSGVRYVQASGNIIDLSNHDPVAISRVWNAGNMQYSQIEDFMFGGVGMMIYDINFTQRFEMMTAYKMLWNELKNQKGENFRLINNTLYLDGYLDNALIEMTVNIKTITDVDDDSIYADWILDYTLALAKEVLGRKRGKVTLQGSPIQLDSASLLSEAASEKVRLEDQLVRRYLCLLGGVKMKGLNSENISKNLLNVLKEGTENECKDKQNLKEGFYNLYNSFDELYGISKYSPKDLVKFLDGLKEANRISDKDYNIMIDFADKYQALINSCGYESSLS